MSILLQQYLFRARSTRILLHPSKASLQKAKRPEILAAQRSVHIYRHAQALRLTQAAQLVRSPDLLSRPSPLSIVRLQQVEIHVPLVAYDLQYISAKSSYTQLSWYKQAIHTFGPCGQTLPQVKQRTGMIIPSLTDLALNLTSQLSWYVSPVPAVMRL